MQTYICKSNNARVRGSVGNFYPVIEEYVVASIYAAEEIFKKEYEIAGYFLCTKFE